MQGIDIDEVLSKKGPARAWNVIYTLVTDGMDEKKKGRFDSDLFRKPVGVQRSGGDQVDQELQKAAQAYLKSLDAQAPAIES